MQNILCLKHDKYLLQPDTDHWAELSQVVNIMCSVLTNTPVLRLGLEMFSKCQTNKNWYLIVLSIKIFLSGASSCTRLFTVLDKKFRLDDSRYVLCYGTWEDSSIIASILYGWGIPTVVGLWHVGHQVLVVVMFTIYHWTSVLDTRPWDHLPSILFYSALVRCAVCVNPHY